MRVVLDARVTGMEGGVGSFIIGLASSLPHLSGDDDYAILTIPGYDDWLRPFIDPRWQVLPARLPRMRPRWQRRLARPVRPIAAPLLAFQHVTPVVPSSNDVANLERVDVIHFTTQNGFKTDIPSIYHPHDLQHLHLPEYFTRNEIASRETYYRELCNQASSIVVSSNWTKADLIANYYIPPEKIEVIMLAPLLSEYPIPSHDALDMARNKFRLPERFVYYPAQTWAHKNHIALLEALASLRRNGIDVSVVSSGVKTDFYRTIKKRSRDLGVEDNAHFVGFVSPIELQCLYRLSQCVVLPTKFESASFPMWEAFLAGTPVASSNVTSLPEQAGDAALLFDPDRPDEIAAAIARLLEDANLRITLVEKGRMRVHDLSWERTARSFRALYQKVADKA